MAATTPTSSLLVDVPCRLLTICVGVPILWWIWSFDLARHLFFQGAHIIMCYEWSQLSKVPMLPFCVTSLILANLDHDGIFLTCLVVAVALLPILVSSSSFPLPLPLAPLSMVLFPWMAGFLVITTPNRTWLAISHDFGATVSLLLTVWNADTGALIAGRLGRLFQTNWPRPIWLRTVSPAKSVEGLLGGLVGGIFTYLSLPWFWSLIHDYGLAPHVVTRDVVFLLEPTIQGRLATGVLLSVAAIIGDLSESSLKRAFGVKDSGRLLPGHGGVLDRFDSSLVAVMVYHYMVLPRQS